MLNEGEITVLISALFLAACTGKFRGELQRIPSWGWLAAAVGCLVLGSISTVVEHATSPRFFDHVEHLGYFLQSIFIAVWALRVGKRAA